MTRLKLAIGISGRGSNMEALMRAALAPDFPAVPVLVFCNRPDAPGLERAGSYGIDTLIVDHKDYADDREAFERLLDTGLRAHQVDIIALAGFMRVLTPWFVDRWKARMINIHPSLLPKYPGLHTHRRALEAGDLEHGCTVHWVTPGVDEGAIIAQVRVPVLEGDDEATLADRVREAEHRLYPQALADACRTLA